MLGARSPAESSSLAIRLLGDLRQVFGGADRLWTRDILHRLHAIDDAPWSDLGGRPITARRLAGLLRPFGVNRTEVRIGDSTTKGLPSRRPG